MDRAEPLGPVPIGFGPQIPDSEFELYFDYWTSENNQFKEINSASERQFNNVIAAVEKVLEDHRLQIEDLYSSVRICPSGSLRFGPQVTLDQIKII